VAWLNFKFQIVSSASEKLNARNLSDRFPLYQHIAMILAAAMGLQKDSSPDRSMFSDHVAKVLQKVVHARVEAGCETGSSPGKEARQHPPVLRSGAGFDTTVDSEIRKAIGSAGVAGWNRTW
jgi:hypothetical protein